MTSIRNESTVVLFDLRIVISGGGGRGGGKVCQIYGKTKKNL